MCINISFFSFEKRRRRCFFYFLFCVREWSVVVALCQNPPPPNIPFPESLTHTHTRHTDSNFFSFWLSALFETSFRLVHYFSLILRERYLLLSCTIRNSMMSNNKNGNSLFLFLSGCEKKKLTFNSQLMFCKRGGGGYGVWNARDELQPHGAVVWAIEPRGIKTFSLIWHTNWRSGGGGGGLFFWLDYWLVN